MELPLLGDILVIFALSILVVLVFERLGIPSIIGFLLTGALAGPRGLGLVLAVTWLTSIAGLSLALGAFLAGLILSESEYGHEALGHLIPFRDVFTSFFFVSVGMLLDLPFIAANPGRILGLSLAVLAVKAVLCTLATILIGFPLRTSLLTGLALCQLGEFSFVLSRSGVEHGLLSGSRFQLFMGVSVMTMAATPLVIALAPRIAHRVSRVPLPLRLRAGFESAPAHEASKNLSNHLVIVGFGLNGRNLARAARAGGIHHVILEVNPEAVREGRSRGEPIFYGDATKDTVLAHAGVGSARVLVVAISDPEATRRVVEAARRLNPTVHVIARTRYVQEVRPLLEKGADEVIPEEFETSVEIFTRVLRSYLLPDEDIERLIHEIRADGYEMLRAVAVRGSDG